VTRQIGLDSFIPHATALSLSMEALYEILGDLARQVFAALHLRQHSR